MKQIKISKEHLTWIYIAATVLAVLGVYLIFYAPLMKDLSMSRDLARSVEIDVIEVRDTIDMAKEVYREKIVISEEDIAIAIDELTKDGKSKGVNFLSISPGQIEENPEQVYETLPIRMQIDAEYEQMATFFGALDDLGKGLVTIKSFDIHPNENDPTKVTADMMAEMYVIKS